MGLLSLSIPIIYLSILVGSLATFSHLYRQRKLNAKLRLAPYFGPHTARDVYLTLLHQSDSQSDVKVPNSILCAALQERAVEDILRIMEVRTRKGPLNTLLQRGVVGDEMWQRLLRAEQELELELKDVVAEANALATGWGQSIFQSAGEIAQNRMLKNRLEEVKGTIEPEKKIWEETREKSRRELLESDVVRTVDQAQPAAAAAVAAVKKQGTSAAGAGPAIMRSTTNSDEDAVMVETPNAETPPAVATGGTKKNKKKGKK